jgi:uncharacterized protein YggU (UPF0235/DUF167 family)
VPLHAVEIISGESSRDKRIRIRGVWRSRCGASVGVLRFGSAATYSVESCD